MADTVRPDTTPPVAPGIRVFVYGTLKASKSNARVLGNAEFLGRCVIEDTHRMVDLGFYPGLVRDPSPYAGRRKVLGEVYRINRDHLATLDLIEGHPVYYARTKVTTPWKGAWAYYLPSEYLDAREPVESVEGVQVWRPTDEEVQYVRNCQLTGT